MNKIIKIVLTFIVSLIIAYIMVGYIANNVFAQIHWEEGVTAWDKFREYYIRTYSINIIPSLILALIPTSIVMYKYKIRR